MIRINIHEAKAHLSRLLARVEEEGVSILICRRNVPIAEIRALPRPSQEPRKFGQLAGQLEVPDSFFESLPEGVLEGFEGGGEDS